MKRRLAAAAACALLVCAVPDARAESFVTATGAFVKDGNTWKEVPNGATFLELGRNDEVVEIYDESRNMYVRLPIAGGMSTWAVPPNSPGPNNLAEGKYIK